jgi:hypothetical protein
MQVLLRGEKSFVMCIFIGKNEFFIGGMIFVTSIFPVGKLLSSFFFIGKKSASGVISEGNSGHDHPACEEKQR